MMEQQKLNQLLNVRYSGLLEENVFGYVQIRKPELKIKDYSIYHGFYCGLCERLRDKYGLKGRITLTYDMTFMAVFLSSLYDAENIVAEKNTVIAQYHYSVLHKGTFVGKPATQKRVEWDEVAIIRFGTDGKITDMWYMCEELKLALQLGFALE